jgi:proteasome accessory factor B
MPSRKPRKKPPAPKRPPREASPKLVRWLDLLGALLGHDQAVPLEQLKEEVPGYASIRTFTALRRAFERDKDELREYGVPISTERDAGGEVRGYRLRRDHFYLPYLALLQDGRPAKHRTIDRYGYRSLEKLTFDADELEAVREAALRVRRLGIPALEELATSAMRKLAFDLPVHAVRERDEAVARNRAKVVRPQIDLAAPSSLGVAESADWAMLREAPATYDRMSQSEIFDVLETALRARKRVTIAYTTMSTGLTAERDVHPYGLFFLGQHWYLAACDAGTTGPVKNFRLSRVLRAERNARKPGKADYEIPAAFALPKHARSREAWELGDTATVECVVRFPGESGPTAAARRLGEPVKGDPRARRFHVRRLDGFARWILSFAGEAEPVSPDELVAAYDALAATTLALYAER